jgi:hypothetical protein
MQYLDLMLLMIILARVPLLFCRILQKIRSKTVYQRRKSQVIMRYSCNPSWRGFPG